MKGMRLKVRLRQHLRMRTNVKFIAFSVVTVVLYGAALSLLFMLNFSAPEISKAGSPDNLSSGDIICKFTWDKGSPTKADEGPDAMSISKTACISNGGRSSTNALNPGKPGLPVNMMLPGSPYFNVPGIDIGIDFRRSEGSGNFFTRGSGFNFGMEKGFIVISYRIENGKGGYKTIEAVTSYSIPIDEIWRNYRFIYTPSTGKGEVFVNSVVVWSNQATPNTKLFWNDDSNVVIGKDMDGGGGMDRSIFDNLIVRSTGSVESSLQSLLAFTALPQDNKMLVTWSMIPGINDNYFLIERSVNGVDFSRLGNVKAAPAGNTVADYQYTDLHPVAYGVTYYRIKYFSNDGQFVQYPATAVSTKSKLIEDIAIENITPLPFSNTFDVTYSTAGAGEVLMKLIDKQGTVCLSEKMNASRGKNIHVFRDTAKLNSGIYTINLTYNNKSVFKKIIKS